MIIDPSVKPLLRYAGVMQLLFITNHLNLIGVWFGEDLERSNAIQSQTHNIYKRSDSDYCIFKIHKLPHTQE
jgi:hypothetical protein